MDMKKFKENAKGIAIGGLGLLVVILCGMLVLSDIKDATEQGIEFCADKEGIYESDICAYINCSNKENPCVLNLVANTGGDDMNGIKNI